MAPGRRVRTFAALAVTTGVLAFVAANHGGSFWSRVLVAPWALVLTGILFILLFDPVLVGSDPPWAAQASHVLVGAAVAFALHEVLVRAYREVIAGVLSAAQAGFVVMGLVVLAGLVLALANAFGRRSADERLSVAGAAAALAVAGSFSGLALLPAVLAIGLQLVLLGHILKAPLDAADLIRAGAAAALVLAAGLLALTLVHGQLLPPKLVLDAPAASRWLTPLLVLASCAFVGSLAWNWWCRRHRLST